MKYKSSTTTTKIITKNLFKRKPKSKIKTKNIKVSRAFEQLD